MRARRLAERRSLLAATLAASLLGLAACSEDAPAPAPLDTSAATATPSTTPTVDSAPTLPAAASGTSPRAAKAFVRHWIDLLNHATQTGSTAAVRDLSSAECDTCRSLFEAIERVYENQGTFEGGRWSVRQLVYQSFQPRREPLVEATIRFEPQVVIEAEGTEPLRFDGGQRLYSFRLDYRDGRWKLQSLGSTS